MDEVMHVGAAEKAIPDGNEREFNPRVHVESHIASR
jgi:hypothetical protein